MFRTFLATITLAAPAITVAPLPSHAQSDYPNRIVKIVVPYGAGTVPDILARALTTGLSGRLGQQFIVENKAGGSGALGTASVVRAEADGYTVLFAPAVVLSVLPQSRNDTGYRHDSLVPVCQTFVNTMGLAVRPDSPIKSIGDLVATAKQKPGALNYGHPGVMTIPHLAMEEFLQAAAIEIKDIPFQHFQGASLELFWNIYAINIFAFNHNARQSRGFIEYPRCCLPRRSRRGVKIVWVTL
jgi:tripartite-type tricarboxylate transporter receptor subunit TctC